MLKWIDIIKLANQGNPAPDQTVVKTEAEWKAQLSEEEYRITRLKGTERPHSSEMCSLFEPGLYACVCCGTLLFDGQQKFESGTGWPSFTQPVKDNAVAYHADNAWGMRRIEALCNTCQAHLGHVFPDGPAPSRLRYCMNAVSLKKVETKYEKATFGGGCFWCTEAIFEQLKGVLKVESGYSGGKNINPTYREVCSGATGHAEVVQITFDPALISYDDLLRIHLSTHNPTLQNQQETDWGTQYRSIIFTHSDQQNDSAQKIIAELKPASNKEILTEVRPLDAFFKAENHHQNYYSSNPEKAYCETVINPKLEKLRALFKDKMKDPA
ncbi:MAG TPA: bifunctional methionine sulfoxide reductase B/A protein [Pedobacter sp.]